MKAFKLMEPFLSRDDVDSVNEILLLKIPEKRYDEFKELGKWQELSVSYWKQDGCIVFTCLDIYDEGDLIKEGNGLYPCEIEFHGKRYNFKDVVWFPNEKTMNEFYDTELTMTPEQAAKFEFKLFYNGEDITKYLERPRHLVASRYLRLGLQR